MQRRMLALLASSAAAVAVALPAPSMAHGAGGGSSPRVTVLNGEVGAPYNLDISHKGLLVADGGPGLISLLRRDGGLTTVVPDVIGASGVATSWKALAYTSTTTDPDTFENSASSVEIQYRNGAHVHADTLAYENASNPDSVNTSGIADPTPCQSELLAPLGGANYTGLIDSHAYSVAAWGGAWLLADAGGNDLLAVDGRGNISTIAVFPAQQIKITQAFLDANFPPDVDTPLVGATFGFEPVPTDVEVGRNGSVYVTTLPGGAEDDSLGANGAVWRVNPWNGHVEEDRVGTARRDQPGAERRQDLRDRTLRRPRVGGEGASRAAVRRPARRCLDRGRTSRNALRGHDRPDLPGPGLDRPHRRSRPLAPPVT